jgi:hypothetical protein
MKRILFACLILCLWVISFSLAIAQTIQKIAFSGDPAPGLPGLTYTGFQGMHLNNRGEVFFNGALQGPGIQNHTNTGMWRSTSSGVELIAREFDIAPGLYQGEPGVPASEMHFNDFKFDSSFPRYSTAGDHTVFQTRLLGRHQNSTQVISGPGAWFITSNSLQIFTASGLPQPGLASDLMLASFNQISVNTLGQVAFGAKITPNGQSINGEGIWSDVNGSLELIARTNEQVAGMPLGIQFSFFNSFRPVLNDAGKLVFTASLQGTGVTSANSSVLLVGSVGNFSPIVRGGDPAPDTTSDVTFTGFLDPKLDADDRVLFQGRLTGSGIDDTNDWGIWLEDQGSIELVARHGTPAPGLPNGVVFSNFDPQDVTPRYSPSGHMALRSFVTGPGIDSSNDQGVWWGTPDNLQLIAREGGTLPGVPVGEHITTVGGSMNESGQLFLSGQLSLRTFSDGINDQAFWAQDRFGELQMIVKTGDLLEVTPGVFLQARSLEYGGFNNRGQVLFKAFFQTDLPFQTIYQSGLFVSNLVAVPEPSSLLLMFAGVFTLGMRTPSRN